MPDVGCRLLRHPDGHGKPHPAIALGLKARELGFTVRFTTVQDLATRLRAARADRLVHHTHLVPIVGESQRMKDL